MKIETTNKQGGLVSWGEYSRDIMNAEPDDQEQYILSGLSVENKRAYGAAARGLVQGVAKKMADIDNAATLGVVRALEYVRAQIIEEQYSYLPWRELMYVDTSAPWYTDAIRENFMSSAGGAAALYGDDFQGEDSLVEMDTTSAAKGVINTRKSYAFSPMELARAAVQGLQLNTTKAKLARRSIEETLNRVALFGDPQTGIKGLFTTGQGVTAAQVAAVGGDYTWALKIVDDPDSVIADVQEILNAVATDSGEIFNAKQLWLPPESRRLLFQTRMSDSLAETLGSHILNTMPELGGSAENIRGVVGLSTAGTGSSKLMVASPGIDASVVVCDLPMDFTQLEPEISPVRTRVRCIARTAGVTIKQPLGLKFRYGI